MNMSELLQQLKDASAKATSGPWESAQDLNIKDHLKRHIVAVNKGFIATTYDKNWLNDADFIALARNHIDDLIERVEELESSHENQGIFQKGIYTENQSLAAENAKLREALEFYARAEHVMRESEPLRGNVCPSFGHYARECLASLDKERK